MYNYRHTDGKRIHALMYLLVLALPSKHCVYLVISSADKQRKTSIFQLYNRHLSFPPSS